MCLSRASIKSELPTDVVIKMCFNRPRSGAQAYRIQVANIVNTLSCCRSQSTVSHSLLPSLPSVTQYLGFPTPLEGVLVAAPESGIKSQGSKIITHI